MFSDCKSLTSLDLSNFDTSNVTNMSYMFDGCRSITSLDLSNFNTSKVTTMECMFSTCSSLRSLNITSFDTSKVERMRLMFWRSPSLSTLDLSSFDTSGLGDGEFYTEGMFAEDTSLRTVYARTQTDADRFKNSSSVPSITRFVVK